jgi:hypothetical protein
VQEKVERCLESVNSETYDEEDDVSIPCGQKPNDSYTTTIGAASDRSESRSTPRDGVPGPTRTIATQTVEPQEWGSVSNWIRTSNVSIFHSVILKMLLYLISTG